MNVSALFVLVLGIVDVSECAKILGVWSIMTSSHFILGSRLMQILADAGHDVTLISPYDVTPATKNGTYRSIPFKINFKGKNDITKIDYFNVYMLDTFTLPLAAFDNNMEDLLDDENVRRLLNSDEKFDVVIVEQFGNDALKGLAHHFNAHLIIFSSLFANEWVNDLVGNPSPTSYVPVITSTLPTKMSLLQRAHNTAMYLCRRLITYLYLEREQERILRKYFPTAPGIKEIMSNTSLLFLNSHESLTQPVPTVPNVVQVGGYHIEPPKRLPEDLQRLMDESTEGVIYFSLGSLLKSNTLPVARRKMFFDTFKELKQRVLWKWDNDTMSEQPENVEIRRWLPQSEILAHPNVKLFITHGGLLGSTEAVYHGVPVLAIPVFADQVTNGRNAENAGYGLCLPYTSSEFTQDKLESMIRELLDNPRYQNNAKERSRIFHNRPMSPKEAITYWVEYVIQTNGAHHLKVEGIDMPWYQYYLADVALLAILITGSPLLLLVSFCRFVRHVRTVKEKRS